MICAVIKGPTLKLALDQMQKAASADLLEIRLDFFLNLDDLKSIVAAAKIPLIFTLRSKDQGGNFNGTEEERLNHIESISHLNPAFLDIEHNVPKAFISNLQAKFPKQKIILSYHNFEQTPDDLQLLLKEMQTTQANVYKIATMTNSSLDMLRLLSFGKDQGIIAIGMGPYGEPGRILCACNEMLWTYACIDENHQTAPGQLPLNTLDTVYNRGHEVYGLIGDPVAHSIGHFTHNAVFRELKVPAVYVKIPVKKHELADFFSYAKKNGFRGLSVTQPHKEAVIPFLDEIDPYAQAIGAVNTIHFVDGKLKGYNTDAKAAIDAIGQPVEGKSISIIGAGGAARAIAYEACQRGANVTIHNRTKQKGLALAERFGCSASGLDDISEDYDILINTTPALLPLHHKDIHDGALIMDITTQPKETALIKCAQQKGCQVVYGYQMFVNQAVSQFKIWVPHLESSQVQEILQQNSLKHI